MSTYRLFKKGSVRVTKLGKYTKEKHAIIYFEPREKYGLAIRLLEVRVFKISERCLVSEVEMSPWSGL
jgi:hypothetical protein